MKNLKITTSNTASANDLVPKQQTMTDSKVGSPKQMYKIQGTIQNFQNHGEIDSNGGAESLESGVLMSERPQSPLSKFKTMDEEQTYRESNNIDNLKIGLKGNEIEMETSKQEPIFTTHGIQNEHVYDPITSNVNLKDHATKSLYIHDIDDPANTNCLIYPDNKLFQSWEMFMTLILLISCVMTPIEIAFSPHVTAKSGSTFQQKFELFMDVLFFIDVILTFNTAILNDSNWTIEANRKNIAISYLKSWFVVDVLSCFPFGLLNHGNEGQTNNSQIASLAKAYKFVKLIKLTRIMKIMKDKNRFFYYMDEYLKIGTGFQRLMFYGLIFILASHIATCFWIILATLMGNSSYDGTWLEPFYADGLTNEGQIYQVSLYWCITTITTVGYGDISGTNNPERMFCSFVMVVGVIMFSLANGALASIISQEDNGIGGFDDQISALNLANKNFLLPQHLYIQCYKSIYYQHEHQSTSMDVMIQSLPKQLKMKMSIFAYEKRYKTLRFFQGRSVQFISWICPLMKPAWYDHYAYLFLNGDDIKEMYFLQKGVAEFVLPRFDNVSYVRLKPSNHFGLIDIVGSAQKNRFDIDDWYQNSFRLQRQFTCRVAQECEVLYLTVETLHQMKLEFSNEFDCIFDSIVKRYETTKQKKMLAFQLCEQGRINEVVNQDMNELDHNNSYNVQSVVDNKLDKKKANSDCFGGSNDECTRKQDALNIITSKNNLIFEVKNQGKQRVEKFEKGQNQKEKQPDRADLLIGLITKSNEQQDKKINQMMGMINNLHEGLFRLEKKLDKVTE